MPLSRVLAKPSLAHYAAVLAERRQGQPRRVQPSRNRTRGTECGGTLVDTYVAPWLLSKAEPTPSCCRLQIGVEVRGRGGVWSMEGHGRHGRVSAAPNTALRRSPGHPAMAVHPLPPCLE